MHHSYEFVSEQEYKPVKERLEQLIQEVQDYLRKDHYPILYKYVGSAERDMITRDPTTNVGYDFDLNIYFENRLCYLSSPQTIKAKIMNAFNKHVEKYGYNFCEDSTRVITIKTINHTNSTIIHSADFCIIKDLPNGQIQIIKNNKQTNSYYWETLSQYPIELSERAAALKNRGYWNKVKELYLRKKK